LCQTYAYIHHETEESNFKEHEVDNTFKEFIEKKGYTPSKNKEMYLKYFNEMFENVHIKDDDGYTEWLKSEEGIYDKND
jgi:DNA phosphorothioation-dependent restriction protein DptG